LFRTTLLLASVAAGCGAPDERPPPSAADDLDLTDLSDYDASTGDVRDIVATGGCAEGERKTCRVYLPSHNGVQPCFVGEQLCSGSVWSDCGSAVLVDANADDAELDAETLDP
jgi:hypothetical protein